MTAARKSGSGLSGAALETLYQAAAYHVDDPTRPFVLRIGRPSPEADALAAAHEVRTWAYITAYNPGSVAAALERNQARQRELEHAVTEAGYRFCRGEGKADDDAWPPEPSLMVFGIGEEEAAALARRFQQAAIVCGERGGSARLVWIDGERARS
jgi:Protein of unknown function (DUF3293)